MTDINTFGGKKILVVEDDCLIVMDLVQRLESRGAEVIGPIPTLQQALERTALASDLDGAVLDIDLQGRMVFPLAERLRRRGVPFVFLSGYGGAAVPPEFAEVPRYSKTADADEVIAALQEVADYAAAPERRADPHLAV